MAAGDKMVDDELLAALKQSYQLSKDTAREIMARRDTSAAGDLEFRQALRLVALLGLSVRFAELQQKLAELAEGGRCSR